MIKQVHGIRVMRYIMLQIFEKSKRIIYHRIMRQYGQILNCCFTMLVRKSIQMRSLDHTTLLLRQRLYVL